MKKVKEITIPISDAIVFTVYQYEKGGAITATGLESECSAKEREDNPCAECYAFEAQVSSLYSIILAHSQVGIDVTTPEYVAGIQAALSDIDRYSDCQKG